ncbi:hypothetical protein CLHOM_24400 [Clostridium homopropionicum DSM 5847]|uniref:Uncharacterized protein n=1 Tax=Clostridium homopropionicum DSM 5847 TaxID=1121318 RepID=A0A0L6Z8P7_9CLOT|nr:hypothetical protein [Clostridium homopropionicum]KOA19334.1 hypothetical protein CLHOM_24400 [Clostridium homopropionicum DSM 5847]SFG21519.1 hypothetical protein SAMN04488501_106200 [Clostridium homopropionicum]
MIGINRITGQAEIPNIIKNNFISITLIIIPLFVFSIIFRLPYFNVVMGYKKENKILKNINEMILNKIKSILKAIKEPN